MLKKYSFLFFFLFSVSIGLGQTKEIDSLKQDLMIAQLDDTTRVSNYLKLAGKYGPFNMDSLYKYTRLASKFSKINDNYKLDGVLYYLGIYHAEIGQIDKAKEYYLEAIDILDSINNKDRLSKLYGNYGNILSERTELNEKIIFFRKSLRLKEDLGNPLDVGKSQYNLAVLYSRTGFDSLAVVYLKKALKNGEESKVKPFTAHVLNFLTAYSLKNNNLVDAEEAINKSEKICKETNSNRSCYNTFIQKGKYLERIEQLAEAEKAFHKALKYAASLKAPRDLMFAYASLGNHYVKVGKPHKAIENFKLAKENNTDGNEFVLGQIAYEKWAEAEKMIGNSKNSLEFLEKYIKTKDSLNTQNNKSALANANAKYETEKKDKEIAEQNLALTESKSKTRTMNILIVSLLLGSILLWFSFRQRQKRMQQQLVSIEKEQEVRTLESLMEGEENERLRIAKELHDGVNGDLAAIKFKLTSLLETNNKVINEAVAMIDTSSEQVRAISHNLVPPSLRDFNLLEAVSTYCENMNAIHEAEISFQHLGNEILLEKKQEANLFRIVQELVTNSIKHAEAKEIMVQLSNVEDNLQLTVEDDGKGFDPKNVESDGIGMQNVKSRVDYLSGLLDIKSDSKGTSFTITITDKPEKT